jgi:hypothetical protein
MESKQLVQKCDSSPSNKRPFRRSRARNSFRALVCSVDAGAGAVGNDRRRSSSCAKCSTLGLSMVHRAARPRGDRDTRQSFAESFGGIQASLYTPKS